MEYGNPVKSVQHIKMKKLKVGIEWTRPVIWDEDLVLNRFDITSIKKKKIHDNRQWVAINSDVISSPNSWFHKIGMHKKFIS